MAQVLLVSAAHTKDTADYNRGALRRLERSAEIDIFHRHSVTNDPSVAEIILFAELHGAGAYFERVRRHPYVKAYRDKCFVFCPNDFILPLLPGVYACIERRWASRRTCSGFYLGVWENKFIAFLPPSDGLPYLYSFIGSINTAPVRRRLAALPHTRAFFRDVSAEYSRALYGTMSTEEMRNYRRRYVEITQASKFILCPRGLGVSSVRLFDTMQMGRVPVILSDDWVEPPGPDWSQFSLRVRERDYARVPALLNEHESRAVEMGLLARAAWEKWFSDEVAFHRAVESCLSIRRRRRIPESWARLPVYLQFLRPFHFRHWLRTRRPKWSDGNASPV